MTVGTVALCHQVLKVSEDLVNHMYFIAHQLVNRSRLLNVQVMQFNTVKLVENPYFLYKICN